MKCLQPRQIQPEIHFSYLWVTILWESVCICGGIVCFLLDPGNKLSEPPHDFGWRCMRQGVSEIHISCNIYRSQPVGSWCLSLAVSISGVSGKPCKKGSRTWWRKKWKERSWRFRKTSVMVSGEMSKTPGDWTYLGYFGVVLTDLVKSGVVLCGLVGISIISIIQELRIWMNQPW